MSAVKWFGMALLTVGLAGCANAPVPSSAEEKTPPRLDGLQLLERNYLERTKRFAFEGRLVEAAQAWEVLVALRPQLPEYRSALERVNARIEAATSENMEKAQQAQRKGDQESAARFFLAVLALKPDHPQALEAMRSIERDRVKRTQLGRSSSTMVVRRSQSEMQIANRKNSEITNVLEHATLLQRQGDTTDAVALLRVYLDSNPGDKEAGELLQELQSRKTEPGKLVSPSNRNAAGTR